ncbi:hypothetical protein KHA94_09110 [Bacillus sp. FJAT-49705]|uniref:YopX protein domain-containing protein n=1 Tax=Cytobacillus citreus TaxID=2833586 RepID=A0ABS5NRB5_9BACI|nr:hypothetical protein [Cytobacillus citreus]
MREPKFRGFSIETNSWHYGHGWFKCDYTEEYKQEKGITDNAILYTDGSPVECELKSMGQFIGRLDQNGKEIFAGDIMRREFEISRDIIDPVSLGFVDREIEESGYFIGVVNYRPSEGFVLNKCKKFNEDGEIISQLSGVKIYPKYATVIGNIYENPELINS